MVKIEDKRLVIVVDHPRPAEFWTDIADDLLDLLQCEDENCKNPHYATLSLLRALMLDYAQAECLKS